MSNRDYIPSRDADLLAWSANYSQKLTATPTVYGITAAQATAYAALHAAFSTALATATNPATRTRGSIASKDASRDPLKSAARDLARIINAYPSTTNQQRLDLGLNPRTGEITPSHAPGYAPVMEIIAAVGRTLKVRLHGLGSDRRGRPEGVDGATVFSFVGSAPPADISDWEFQGSTTRTTFDVEFPPTVAAGAQVWLCAFWFSPRKESGPACQPVTAYLAGGVAGGAQAA